MTILGKPLQYSIFFSSYVIDIIIIAYTNYYVRKTPIGPIIDSMVFILSIITGLWAIASLITFCIVQKVKHIVHTIYGGVRMFSIFCLMVYIGSYLEYMYYKPFFETVPNQFDYYMSLIPLMLGNAVFMIVLISSGMFYILLSVGLFSNAANSD